MQVGGARFEWSLLDKFERINYAKYTCATLSGEERVACTFRDSVWLRLCECSFALTSRKGSNRLPDRLNHAPKLHASQYGPAK